MRKLIKVPGLHFEILPPFLFPFPCTPHLLFQPHLLRCQVFRTSYLTYAFTDPSSSQLAPLT